MSRCVAAGVLLALSVPAGSAPRLKDEPARVYFPTAVGDRWVTEMRYKTHTTEYTEVVTAVEKKDGATIVTVGREADGRVGSLSQVKVADDGLFRLSHLGTTYDPPYRILQLPLKPGVAWSSEAASGGGAGTRFKYKAVGPDDVAVPAGKFRAFRLDVDIETQGGSSRSAIWYAPNVGIVKLEHEDGDSGYVRVLKSFTPGKK